MSVQGVAISLFSGAGGLDLGAEAAGYEVRAAVEWDHDAAVTMEKNFAHLVSPVIRADILQTPTRQILEAAGLRRSKPAFDRLIREIDEAGYHCNAKVLNATDYGVPQSRPRLFIIGTPKDRPLPRHPEPTPTGRM